MSSALDPLQAQTPEVKNGSKVPACAALDLVCRIVVRSVTAALRALSNAS